MRGDSSGQHDAFSYEGLEERIPADDPLGTIRTRADDALKRISPLFHQIYAKSGRLSIPPGQLLKALVLIALYSVRPDRQFCESLAMEPVVPLVSWHDDGRAGLRQSTFSKCRERLLEHQVAQRFFVEVLKQAKAERLLTEEHFSTWPTTSRIRREIRAGFGVFASAAYATTTLRTSFRTRTSTRPSNRKPALTASPPIATARSTAPMCRYTP